MWVGPKMVATPFWDMSSQIRRGRIPLFTNKNGRERVIFFIDQVVDMIAYPVPNKYGNNGRRTGPFVNGRGELRYPSKCNPRDYPEVHATSCDQKKVSDRTCAGFAPVSCYTNHRGHIEGPKEGGQKCTGGSLLKRLRADKDKCQKKCALHPSCTAIEVASRSCKLFSGNVGSEHSRPGVMCLKDNTGKSDQVKLAQKPSKKASQKPKAQLAANWCVDIGCGSRYMPSRKCQCNEQCLNFQNCCDDYQDFCHPVYIV